MNKSAPTRESVAYWGLAKTPRMRSPHAGLRWTAVGDGSFDFGFVCNHLFNKTILNDRSLAILGGLVSGHQSSCQA